ncbi:MAG TPA: ATP-binding protein [Myxococcaceae bacterium]|jgi:PAS domain S-box-containing protein
MARIVHSGHGWASPAVHGRRTRKGDVRFVNIKVPITRQGQESGMAMDGAGSRSYEAQLEELRQTLASVEASLWDLHLSTQEFRVSRRWLELLGYAEGELEPNLSAWKRLCHPEDLPMLERCLQEHQEGRSPLAEFMYRVRRKDGRWIWLLCRVRAVAHDEGGRPVRLQATEVDITACMSSIALELNNPVSHVMSLLGLLRQYFQELQPVLQAQREFIQGGADVDPGAQFEQWARLRELWAGQQLEEILRDIPEALQDSLMATLRIRDIVQRLRVSTLQNSGELQWVDLNTELEYALKIVWGTIRDKCEVKREYGALPSVACFPSQLAQVFTHLLVNAAQAIEERGVISIRTWRDGDEVAVEISDTGKGMTPETLAKLATPFFTTKREGMGLGLYTSYGIISSLKGRIEVRSEPGQGTAFTIRFPLSAG